MIYLSARCVLSSLKVISFVLFLRRANDSQEPPLTERRQGCLSVHQAATPFHSSPMTLFQRLPGPSGFSRVPHEIGSYVGNLN